VSLRQIDGDEQADWATVPEPDAAVLGDQGSLASCYDVSTSSLFLQHPGDPALRRLQDGTLRRLQCSLAARDVRVAVQLLRPPLRGLWRARTSLLPALRSAYLP
jgi:hypothetical protein